MKKGTIVILALAICILIMFFAYLKITNFSGNLYKNVTTDILIEMQNEKDNFIVFYYQNNCMSCKQVKPIINKFIEENGCQIYAVNLSEASNENYLAEVIRISETPTIIIYEKGEEKRRLSSIFKEEELRSFIYM